MNRRSERISEALKGVDFSASDFSVDRLYTEKFPDEVDEHTFRVAVMAAMKADEKKPEAKA